MLNLVAHAQKLHGKESTGCLPMQPMLSEWLQKLLGRRWSIKYLAQQKTFLLRICRCYLEDDQVLITGPTIKLRLIFCACAYTNWKMFKYMIAGPTIKLCLICCACAMLKHTLEDVQVLFAGPTIKLRLICWACSDTNWKMFKYWLLAQQSNYAGFVAHAQTLTWSCSSTDCWPNNKTTLNLLPMRRH